MSQVFAERDVSKPVDDEPLLSVESLAAGYGDLTVLWDISLMVRPGQATVVLGRNGAGKTTLLSTIAGILKPTAGRIEFGGTSITKWSAPRRTKGGIALVQEGKRVFRRRTVEENLMLGGHTMPRSGLADAAQEAYEHFPILADKRHIPAGSLSGGQQQMLAIAQALMPKPRLLMLDEPSAGLAPVIVDDVLATVERLKKQGMAILLVEQLVDKALSVADEVAVIEQGKVSISSSIEHTDRDAVRAVYFGGGKD